MQKGASDSTGGRAHNPPSLSPSTIVVLKRGPSSCLVMMKMKMKQTHTCHSQARVRANGDKRATWMETPLRSSVLSLESCYCHQVFLSSNPQFLPFPWNGSSVVVRVHRRQLGLNGTTRSCGTMRQLSWRWSGGHQP